MDKLPATASMMRMAMADTPKVEVMPWGRKYTHYERGIYLRCRVQNDILKVALYLVGNMRAGGKLPAFELYIDKAERKFLTYDHQFRKWRDAKLDRLDWPSYVYNAKSVWISREGRRVIERYLEVDKGGFTALLAFQRVIRQEELKARQKKETDPWDADLSQTPALPKDWEHWVSKVGVPENYMFYEYTRRKDKTGYCTFCERYVPIREPRHNQHGICPRCRHTVQYKAIGKAGHVVTDRYIMYLLQRCRDGVMIRTFEGYRHYGKGRYTMPRCASWEVRRVICDPTGRPLRAYYWAVYKQQHTRWIKGSVAESRYTEYAGKVYGKTLPHLMANELKTTGLTDMIQWKGKVDPERYLSYWQKHPYIEKIVKAGLYKLAS